MRIAFAGTAEVALPVLRAVLGAGHEVAVVITAPNQPAGRGYQLTPPPVKVEAQRLGLPVLQPDRIKDHEFLAALRRAAPEVVVIMAFGQKLTPAFLSLPPHGCLNLHPSLLPKYRGAAPVAWALIRGETETGVTIFRVVKRWDAGDILLQQRVPIRPYETAGELNARLAELGATLMVETLRSVADGTAVFTPQNDADATLAPMLTKEDGVVDWTRPANEVCHRVRGVTPWPGAFTFFHSHSSGPAHRVILLRAKPAEWRGGALPGEVIAADHGLLRVAAGRDAVDILEVKPAGKRGMDGAAFVRGHHVATGDLFGLEA